MNRPRSFGCSIVRSMSWAMRPRISILRHFAPRSIGSIRWFTRTSITASIDAVSPARRRPTTLFRTLGELETRLSRQRFLAGDRITEADWRLFTTLVRFDPVYYVQFKCNLYHIADYFMELYAEALPNSGDRRDRQHRADQTPITMPVTTVPIRAGSSRAGRPSISARRTIAIASSLEARISADAD